MKILFIRHAEPDYELDSLTPKGRIEAELLSLRLEKIPNVEAVYCSPLGRAMDTASYTLKKTGWKCEVLSWLREFRGYTINPENGMKCGAWGYLPRMWKEHSGVSTQGWLQDSLYVSGNIAEVWQEACNGLDAILAKHNYVRKGPVYLCNNNRKGSIIFFCHFGIAMAMLSHITEIPPPILWKNFCIPPSSVTTLVSEERIKGEVFFRCSGLGDVSHLFAGSERVSTAGLYPEVFNGNDTTAPQE